jgi:hypothetical protein
MHPDFAREMIRQRVGEWQARAARAGEARVARAAARERREQAAAVAAREVPPPRVPDFVDGTFREIAARAHAR